jgi:L-amino acid N-acyltransferase YncA
MPKIIDVNLTNVDELGFFCRMSKMKTDGNQKKLAWLKNRFNEGLKIKMLELPDRGFVEYIPGEYAWRGVDAKGYMFIHCLWVVGKSKGKNYGELLLNECIEDAKRQKMKGVAVLVSDDNWMANKKLFLKNGFETVGEAEPSFQLLVKKFKKVANPTFVNNWDQNLRKYKNGITVFVTDQCPYLEDAVLTIKNFTEENKIPLKIVKLNSAEDVRKLSPSPHGTFNIVYKGELLSYYYLLPKDIEKKINPIK